MYKKKVFEEMELHDRHLRNVAQVKPARHRSLEEHIVAAHLGNQQVYDGDGQYRYLNRPLPQSSETVHLLHPTIDSGSVFLTEEPMNADWHYTRDDIPNMLSGDSDVQSHRQSSREYHQTEIDAEEYAKHLHRKNRHHPIYDQPHVPGEALPGIHSHNNPEHFWYGSLDRYQDQPGESRGIENYVSNPSETHRGFYGHTQPSAQATMGEGRGYDRTPGVMTDVPSNLPGREDFEYSDGMQSTSEGVLQTHRQAKDQSYYVWFVVVIMIIVLAALGIVLFYGLAKHSKRLSASQPIVYAHVHPQFLPEGQFPGEA